MFEHLKIIVSCGSHSATPDIFQVTEGVAAGSSASSSRLTSPF